MNNRPQTIAITLLVLVTAIGQLSCSRDDAPTTPSEPTATPIQTSTPTPTLAPGETPPPPTPTPTATAEPVKGLPDGPLLALSPASGTAVSSQAVLVRGTIDPGATASVNGVIMEPDLTGDFFTAVALGAGVNTITVEVTGTLGEVVRKEIKITRS